MIVSVERVSANSQCPSRQFVSAFTVQNTFPEVSGLQFSSGKKVCPPPLPDPHAAAALVRIPPVLACTQLPEVNALSVTFVAIIAPALDTVAFVLPKFKVPPVAVAESVAEPLDEPSNMTLETAGFAVKLGAAELDVAFPNTVKAAECERENVRAGVVVAVATLEVNRGERFPALKLVTVPLLPLVVPQFAK